MDNNNNNNNNNKKDNKKDNEKDNEKDNKKNSLKKEIKRIWQYMKDNKNIVFITILSIFLFYLSTITIETNIFNNNINITKKILKGGSNDMTEFFRKDLIYEYTILEHLSGKRFWDKHVEKEGVPRVLYYIKDAWIIRPIKLLLFFIGSMLAISGSFMAPLIIYGTLFYFLLKKIIKFLFPINRND